MANELEHVAKIATCNQLVLLYATFKCSPLKEARHSSSIFFLFFNILSLYLPASWIPSKAEEVDRHGSTERFDQKLRASLLSHDHEYCACIYLRS